MEHPGLEPDSVGTVDCGDFLRLCLQKVGDSFAKHLKVDHVHSSCFVSVEWKFECVGCLRYIVTSYKDYVIKIDGFQEASFDEHIGSFLGKKVCLCGTLNSVQPLVKHAGKYLFFEVNRSPIESAATAPDHEKQTGRT